MKVSVKAKDDVEMKRVLEEAMYKALSSLGDEAGELSFFCTVEEEQAYMAEAKAA